MIGCVSRELSASINYHPLLQVMTLIHDANSLMQKKIIPTFTVSFMKHVAFS